MRISNAALAAALLAVSLSALPAWAVVATGDDATTETAPTGAYDVDWSFVYQYKGASAVAIDPYWLLTAHHVADDAPTWSMTIGSTTYTEQEVIYHTADADPNNGNTADLALVRLDRPLPGYYDLYTGGFGQGANRLTGVIVGYGYEEGTISAESYTWSTGTSRIKRWGTNVIDGTNLYTISGYTELALQMSFSQTDSDATPYEAGVAVFDSGGAVFVEDNGTWKLGGINVAAASAPITYDLSLAISVPQYADWVTQSVPEPATTSLLGMGGLALLLRYRRRRTA